MGPHWYRLRGLVNPVRHGVYCLSSQLQQFSTCQISLRAQKPGSTSTTPSESFNTKNRDSFLTRFPDSDPEHTGGLVEGDLYYRPTEEDLAKLGYDKPNLQKAKFTALCPAITRHPDIVAVKRRIPSSNIIHHVNRKHRLGIEFNGDDDVLDSKCYREEAEFIATCSKSLEIDYESGGFHPQRLTRKTEAFNSCESTSEYGKKSRNYNDIRSALQDGWSKCIGRGSLQSLLLRALHVCDSYRDLLSLPRYEEPLNVKNIGGASPRWAGAFHCNYSLLDKDFVITEGDDLPTREQKRKYIEDSWDAYDELASRFFVPDVQVFKMQSTENYSDIEVIMTVEIASEEVIGMRQIKHTWNQSLIGLQHSRSTYGLVMGLYSAQLLKIEILDDETIFTSVKNYYFERDGSNLYQSAALVELFGDLVRILWKKNMNLE